MHHGLNGFWDVVEAQGTSFLTGKTEKLTGLYLPHEGPRRLSHEEVFLQKSFVFWFNTQKVSKQSCCGVWPGRRAEPGLLNLWYSDPAHLSAGPEAPLRSLPALRTEPHIRTFKPVLERSL